MNMIQSATFGAGCFWCVEAVFLQLKGVQRVESGYAGGVLNNPTYQDICTGATGHAEVIRIDFDPEVIAYETLLEVFWHTHDPTTLNRQGGDRGTQYRSVIFYHDEAQRTAAEASKVATDASGLWSDPIVTEISPLPDYYPAEAYHQDYYNRNPSQGYCSVAIPPKLKKLHERFPDLV
ncbi:MAG: peptide-methionine (S)-S-oxide reductase [Kiritimatiellia bacterium]|jgi:peptide-methionine (S)-S-oxide reductase